MASLRETITLPKGCLGDDGKVLQIYCLEQ